MSRDFAEMVSALSAAGARFLIVGAHALAWREAPQTDTSDAWLTASRIDKPFEARRSASGVKTRGGSGDQRG